MLSGYKTHITAALIVITAIAAFLTGDMTAVEAFQSGSAALLASFVRVGVGKK